MVAIDLESGGINVLYSSPAYSINKLSNGMSDMEFQDLINDAINLFLIERYKEGIHQHQLLSLQLACMAYQTILWIGILR